MDSYALPSLLNLTFRQTRLTPLLIFATSSLLLCALATLGSFLNKLHYLPQTARTRHATATPTQTPQQG
jgi:hypothetical protein